MSNPLTSIINDAGGYYLQGSGLVIPKGVRYKESSSKAIQVSTSAAVGYNSLELFVKQQIAQSRFKYFLYGQLYKRNYWIRSAMDYIVSRATADHEVLTDDLDPLNPDIRDLSEFFEDANEDETFWDLRERWYYDYLKYGQAYAQIEYTQGRDRRVKALWYLDARSTYPITDEHGTILFHVQNYNGIVSFFNKDEVFYWPARNNGSDPNATPTIETLVSSVAMELQADRFNAALFENNLNLGHVFSMPNATQEDVDDNLRYLEDRYTKPENAWKPLVLKGDAKMVLAGQLQGAKDLSFEELCRVDRQRVCAIFHVPESQLGIPDNTNKATADVYERTTYVLAIKPIREAFINRFTSQFIRKAWKNKRVHLALPESSMLPTPGVIESAGKIAENGVLYSEWRAMVGLKKLPNTDYLVMKIPGAGGYVRLDVTAMPGAGDAKWDPRAYEEAHRNQEAQASQLSMAGIQSAPSSTPYVPPRPQDQMIMDDVTLRILDVSRSTFREWDSVRVAFLEECDTVARRNPTQPGTRGATTLYYTSSGRARYGAGPAGKKAPAGDTQEGADAQNDLTNPSDSGGVPEVDPQTRLLMDTAREQVSVQLRLAQEDNWTNQQFFARLTDLGWEVAPGTEPKYLDVRDAKLAARRLATADTAKAFVIIGSEGAFQVLQRDLSTLGDTGADKGEAPRAGGPNRADLRGVGAKDAKGAANPNVKRSISRPDALDELVTLSQKLLQGGIQA